MFTLRVEMEALDDADATLVERLASMRWRLQPLLAERRIAMEWVMPGEDEDTSPGGEIGLQLALLAQEAMSNAVQHSGSSCLRVLLQKDSTKGWRLEVADKGRGMGALPAQRGGNMQAQRGWGIDGMRNRAQRMGARFELETAPGQGTCVRVWVPVATGTRSTAP